MVKINLLILVMLLICSCGHKVTTLKDGITVIPRDMSIFKNRALFDKRLLTMVDTSAVYKEEYSFLSLNDNSFRPFSTKRSHRSDKYVSYYKFHTDGLVTYFGVPEDNSNPKFDESYSGYRGVYYIKNGSTYIDLFVIVSYGFTPRYGLAKSELLVRGDTIFHKRLNNPRSINVYIKRKW